MNAEQSPAVVETISAYFAALNASDPDALVEVFTDDAALMPNEAETTVGKPALRATYTDRFGVFEYRRQLHVDEWFADGDVAVVRCHTTGSFTTKADGTRVDATSRELFVLKRVEGRWRIRCYMFNPPTPAR